MAACTHTLQASQAYTVQQHCLRAHLSVHSGCLALQQALPSTKSSSIDLDFISVFIPVLCTVFLRHNVT